MSFGCGGGRGPPSTDRFREWRMLKPSLKKLPPIKLSDKLVHSERLKIDCWRRRAPGVEPLLNYAPSSHGKTEKGKNKEKKENQLLCST